MVWHSCPRPSVVAERPNYLRLRIVPTWRPRASSSKVGSRQAAASRISTQVTPSSYTSSQYRTQMTANPSVKPTRSGLRPPRAAYLKRWAARMPVALRLSECIAFRAECFAKNAFAPTSARAARPLASGARPAACPSLARSRSAWAVRPSAASARFAHFHAAKEMRRLPHLALRCQKDSQPCSRRRFTVCALPSSRRQNTKSKLGPSTGCETLLSLPPARREVVASPAECCFAARAMSAAQPFVPADPLRAAPSAGG